MAYKLSHRAAAQELRFPNQRAAEQYADRFGGGLERWDLMIAGHGAAEPATRKVLGTPSPIDY